MSPRTLLSSPEPRSLAPQASRRPTRRWLAALAFAWFTPLGIGGAGGDQNAWGPFFQTSPAIAQDTGPANPLDAESSEPTAEASDPTAEAAEPKVGTETPRAPLELPPGVEQVDIELTDEQREAVRQFVDRRKIWAQTLVEMRSLEIRYSNGDDRSSKNLQRFAELRERARTELRDLIPAAVQLFEAIPRDGESGSFMVTLLDYFREQSIYEGTYPAAKVLLDAEVPVPFLRLVAARAAFLEGRFDEVFPIYQAFVDEHGIDKLEDIDQQLAGLLEIYPEWWEQELAARQADAEADDLPRVRFETTRGPIVIELFENSAPNTVANFIRLIEDGFYDESEFYQVISDLLAMGGDPVGDGSGTSGKFLPDEHERPDARRIFRGSLFMAKMSDASQPGAYVPNSASCQFVIALMPMAPRTMSQTVFGRVIEGMDVVGSFRRIDPSEKSEQTVILPPERILSGSVIRKRDHDYSVEYYQP